MKLTVQTSTSARTRLSLKSVISRLPDSIAVPIYHQLTRRSLQRLTD